MKRSIIYLFVLSLIASVPVNGQGLLKKVTGAMKDELLGTSNKSSANQDPEPGSACSDAELVADLGGKLKLGYKELTISSMDDGSILLQDRISGNYYIVKGGVTQGPMQAGDPGISGFENNDPSGLNVETAMKRYKGVITKSGDKYLINFGGKTYGPFAQINSFVVTRSNDKFAALAVENIVVTGNEGKKMDDAMKNAKTDQERMELALKYSQQMQQKIIQGGGSEGISAKLITNIPNATFNPLTGGTINGRMKFDDILVPAYDRVLDLQGKTIQTIKNEHMGGDIFISSDNSKYAVNQYGTLVFSNNNKQLADMFNPYLIKVGGTVYLTYMYFSPKKNSIMQCKIAF
jgi:hypothetical protein